jgi:P pilus assembly chaperone PapD
VYYQRTLDATFNAFAQRSTPIKHGRFNAAAQVAVQIQLIDIVTDQSMQAPFLKRRAVGVSSARCGSSRTMRALLFLCALLAGAPQTPAVAGVTPVTSRVVMAADATEESLQIFNVNKYPVLVQAWIDDGRIDSVPQESKAPILVLPPIFRMGAGEQTTLRLLNSGAQLPSDRESVFWLNLYEIPGTPKDKRDNEQTITITMRTQIKVFVRPTGKLPYPSTELPKRLTFSLVRQPGHLVLAIDNPTPYYATISGVQIALGEATRETSVDMIAPFSRAAVNVDAPAGPPGEHATLKFALIGDDGAPEIDERELTIGGPGAAAP